MSRLTTSNHSRDSAGMTYVYPVMSRRAGGLSIGINLNTNNACNWRCIYCQVPDLVRGKPAHIDLELLRQELSTLLRSVLQGDFFERYDVPESARTIRDIAISGNGEPTLSAEFCEVIELIEAVTKELNLANSVGRVLISNGSGLERETVQAGLRNLARQGGEVWFKLDSATDDGIQRINQVHLNPKTQLLRLALAAGLCPTRIQTCLFAIDGQKPDALDMEAYLNFMREVKARNIRLRGILLYGLARPSLQPEAERLTTLPATDYEALADSLRQLGFAVSVSI